jgi:hypothetical protein
LTRINRAAALRRLNLVEQGRDELSRLLPDIDRVPATPPWIKGRALFQLALCQWHLADRASAQRSAEESLAAYDKAPNADPFVPDYRRQSEALLADLKDGKPLPAPTPIDAPAALKAARESYQAREALTQLPLDRPAAPLLDQLLGPGVPNQKVFEALDRQYREQGKPPIWSLPLGEPLAPHLDQLLGPARTVRDVLDTLDRQYREPGKPAPVREVPAPVAPAG